MHSSVSPSRTSGPHASCRRHLDRAGWHNGKEGQCLVGTQRVPGAKTVLGNALHEAKVELRAAWRHSGGGDGGFLGGLLGRASRWISSELDLEIEIL